jgi:hypothetical protein
MRFHLTPKGASVAENRFQNWIKRIGVIGFLFFLAKGLVWLAAAGVAALWLR